jgi:coenzyme F420 hydrogenase subunit beta
MIKTILSSNICSGCGLCESAIGKDKIKIELNNNGFYRPKELKELNKRDNDILEKSCPGLINRTKLPSSSKKDKLWGNYYSAYAGYANNQKIRDNASSGGALTAITSYLLEQNKVSAVVHVGANKSKPYENEVKISRTTQDLIENANSRYSPSAPLKSILEILETVDSIAFIGKPCDIAALRQFSKTNEMVSEKVKYYLSFFCAGVPSLNATTNLIDHFKLNKDKMKSVHYRKGGWPGEFIIEDDQNNIRKMSYSESWLKWLGPNVQLRCKLCADGIGHLSDIVCADAWEDFNDKGYPTFKNSPGKSIIISRTLKGNELLKDVEQNHFIKKDKEFQSLRELDEIQPGQLHKKKYALPRMLAMKIMGKKTTKYNKEFVYGGFQFLDIRGNLRNFKGTINRLIQRS